MNAIILIKVLLNINIHILQHILAFIDTIAFILCYLYYLDEKCVSEIMNKFVEFYIYEFYIYINLNL